MYQPNRRFLCLVAAVALLVKILPFLLMHLGLDISRVPAYPWSFTPLFAIGIFGVATFRDWKLGFGLPIAVFLIADVVIGLLAGAAYGAEHGKAFSFYAGQGMTYLALLAACSAGFLVRSRTKNWLAILLAAVAGPTMFYLISNYGSWQFDVYNNYPRTMAGLLTSYAAGLPFYRAHLASTIAFSLLFFSPLGMVQLQRSSAEAKRSSAQPAIE